MCSYAKISINNDNIFEALKRIWAIRCGYDYKQSSDNVLGYIANDLFDIIYKCDSLQITTYINNFHRELTHTMFKPKMNTIESVIWEYRSIISNLQIQKKENNKWITLIKLPKPQKRIFNRIIRGNGRFEDYDLIISKK